MGEVRRQLTFILPVDQIRKLKIYLAHMGMTQQRLMEQMIEERLEGFKKQSEDRAKEGLTKEVSG